MRKLVNHEQFFGKIDLKNQTIPIDFYQIVDTIKMKITYDPKKRKKTLENRGLDFADASFVFKTAVYEIEDTRKDYGEKRIIAVGHLAERIVIIGYVQRGNAKHIFSMRKANEREIKKYQEQFEES